MGCRKRECALCLHNPNKRCDPSSNFDSAFAANQPLKSACDADVSIELYNITTGQVVSVPGVEVQVRGGVGWMDWVDGGNR